MLLSDESKKSAVNSRLVMIRVRVMILYEAIRDISHTLIYLKIKELSSLFHAKQRTTIAELKVCKMFQSVYRKTKNKKKKNRKMKPLKR